MSAEDQTALYAALAHLSTTVDRHLATLDALDWLNASQHAQIGE